jgi:hypothetical protein
MLISSRSEDTSIRVVVRCRPHSFGEKCCVVEEGRRILLRDTRKQQEESYSFEAVFDELCTQEKVWEVVGEPTLERAFAGFNGTGKLLMSACAQSDFSLIWLL